MKLIVDIITQDDKTQQHECVEFPSFHGDFVTLCKAGFERLTIRTATILSMRSQMKP